MKRNCKSIKSTLYLYFYDIVFFLFFYKIIKKITLNLMKIIGFKFQYNKYYSNILNCKKNIILEI